MDRLTAGDLAMVLPEEFGWPQDIGALAILVDAGSLADPAGRFDLETAREEIERRLHLVPRFRQVLYAPRRGLGLPVWVDAPAFDIAEHVDVFQGPVPADEQQLLLAVEELRRLPMDRARPLWRMWFLPGLPGGRVGLFMRLHHAVADGVAGVALLGAFLDPDADAAQPPAQPWVPAPPPSDRELLADTLRRRLHAIGRAVERLARPRQAVQQVRAGWPAVREIFAQRTPRTSLNRPIGSERRLALVRGRLPLAKQIAHANDAKLNDVLLAAIAGGLGDLLRGRGELVDDLVLRAMVPVSLHGRQAGQARGNLSGAMAVPLPVGVPDPVRRLRLIASDTAQRRKRARPAGGTLFPNRWVQRAFLRYATRQRITNVYIANVPGPSVPLHFAGMRVLEVFPLVPIMGNMTLGVGALTYADQFNLTAVADRDRCSDVAVFTEGVRHSLEALAASMPATAVR